MTKPTTRTTRIRRRNKIDNHYSQLLSFFCSMLRFQIIRYTTTTTAFVPHTVSHNDATWWDGGPVMNNRRTDDSCWSELSKDSPLCFGTRERKEALKKTLANVKQNEDCSFGMHVCPLCKKQQQQLWQIQDCVWFGAAHQPISTTMATNVKCKTN